MRRLTIACSAALFAMSLAGTARADGWNKLTYLTFSGPVQMPGITLPAGTYRFELADPDSGRRVVRVSDKDGSKIYGTFLSISDQKLEPSAKPVVMFKETPAGAPQAVRAWFYPGETYGYEFAHPHDQALKIAKATHGSVLAVRDTAQASTDDDRMASMKTAEATRIDENDRPVSTDEHLKDSSSRATTTSSSPMKTQTSTTATTAGGGMPAQANAASSSTTSDRAVGTSGSQAGAATANAAQSNTASRARRSLPRTAGELPLIELLSGLAFAGGFAARAFRRR